MLKLLAMMALTAGMATAGAPAGGMAAGTPQTMTAAQQIDTLFAKATETYEGKGYDPTGWSYKGQLSQGAEQAVTVDLLAGQNYQLVGMCDTDCSDLDATLSDPSGAVVSTDNEADDFPIVGAVAQASGTYTLRLRMIACHADPCAVGAMAFRRKA